MTVKDGSIKKEKEPDIPQEIKEVKEVPKVVGPIHGGLMKRTIKELETLEIPLKDIFEIKGVSINLSWSQIIRLANFNAGKTVLRWDHTFEEALEIIKIFLF